MPGTLLARSRCFLLFTCPFFGVDYPWLGKDIAFAELVRTWSVPLSPGYHSVQEAQTHPVTLSRLELIPDVAFFQVLNYTDYGWDLTFLISLCARSQLGCCYRLVLLSPFFASCGQRIKTYSGISWNGKLDVITQVFWAATDTSPLGGCDLVAE